jgi:hypothetical protein
MSGPRRFQQNVVLDRYAQRFPKTKTGARTAQVLLHGDRAQADDEVQQSHLRVPQRLSRSCLRHHANIGAI